MSMTQPPLEVFADANAVARHAADLLLRLASKTVGRFVVALSGGTTPGVLYRMLATPPYRDRFPWDRVHWFWGDERLVPLDHPRSNYRMAWEAMLSRAPVPAGNIHPVPVGDMFASAAATDYERMLRQFHDEKRFEPEHPFFDVVLLGLGEDGHFASLFPGSPALDERERWVVPAIGPNNEPRITLTCVALQSCRQALFLVTGQTKAPILRRFLDRDPALPASRFAPEGAAQIIADAAAQPSSRIANFGS